MSDCSYGRARDVRKQSTDRAIALQSTGGRATQTEESERGTGKTTMSERDCMGGGGVCARVFFELVNYKKPAKFQKPLKRSRASASSFPVSVT